jgi:F0F1-type ATP synthase assembly protein I
MGAATGAVFAVCVVLGWLADHLLSTSPIFLLVGVAVGILAAGFYTVTQFRKYLNN